MPIRYLLTFEFTIIAGNKICQTEFSVKKLSTRNFILPKYELISI